MAKGYWIVRADVSDTEKFGQYAKGNADAMARHGAKYLVRGGAAECREGEARSRNVVVEFPSVEAARACWEDAVYQHARSLREGAAIFDLVIVEGYDGPQPGQ